MASSTTNTPSLTKARASSCRAGSTDTSPGWRPWRADPSPRRQVSGFRKEPDIFICPAMPLAMDGRGRAPPCAKPRRAGGLFAVFQAHADLQADLPMFDLSVLDVAPQLGHFEPIKVAQRRSEERRVGKECRCGWLPVDYKQVADVV